MEIARNQKQRPIRANGKRYQTMILLPLCLLVWFKSHSGMRQAVDDVTHSKTTAPKSPSITCPHEEFEPRKREEEDSFRVAWTSAVEFVRENRLTFLPQNALEYHRSKLYDIESRGVPGSIVKPVAPFLLRHTRTLAAVFIYSTLSRESRNRLQRTAQTFRRATKTYRKGKLPVNKVPKCNKSYYGNMETCWHMTFHSLKTLVSPPEENAVYFQGLTLLGSFETGFPGLRFNVYDMLECLSP